MKKVEAVINPEKFPEVKKHLTQAGIGKMTVTKVSEFGRGESHIEIYRGQEYSVDFLPQLKIELIVTDQQLALALDAITASRGVDTEEDVEISVFTIEQVVRNGVINLNGQAAKFGVRARLN